jgi:hypothetical protein
LNSRIDSILISAFPCETPFAEPHIRRSSPTYGYNPFRPVRLTLDFSLASFLLVPKASQNVSINRTIIITTESYQLTLKEHRKFSSTVIIVAVLSNVPL